MVKKSVRIALEIFAAVFGFAVLAVAALILWLVQAGPIHLPFLTGYIERGINQADLGAEVIIEDTILTWAGWRRALDVRAVNLHVRDARQRELAVIPEMSVGLSTRALVRGQIAPTRIELIRPEFTLTRRSNGTFALSTGPARDEAEEARPDFLPNLLQELMSPPNRTKPTGYLRQIGIADGNVTIKDRQAGLTWRIDHVSLQMDRSAQGMEGTLFIESPQFGTPAIFEGRLNFRTGDKAVRLAAQLRGFDLASLGLIHESLTQMQATQFQLSGSAETNIGMDGTISPIKVRMSGGPGTIDHPDILREKLALQNFSLIGEVDLAQDYIAIASLTLDLTGPKLSLSGTIKGAMTTKELVEAEFSISAQALSVEKLKASWPIGVAKDAFAWIDDNITQGQIDHLVAEASLSLPRGDDLHLNILTGTFAGSGLTVHYLAPMPPIEGGQVEAHFDQKQLTGQVLAGHVGDIQIIGGEVAFRGLDEKDQFIDVKGSIGSSIKDALMLLDHPRLGYPSQLGLKPDESTGQAEIQLVMSFPALKNLPFAQVHLGTEAKLTGAGIKNVLFGKDASNGQLSLKLDNAGMVVEGLVELGGVPLDLHWQENFSLKSNNNVARMVRAKVTISAEQSASMGFDFRPFLDGESAYDLDYTAFASKVAKLEMDLNLTKARFDIPFLNWRKEGGEEAGGKLIITLENDTPRRIDFFSISSNGMNANGTAVFTKDGKNIESAHFKRLLIDKTNLGDVVFAKNGDAFDIDLGSGIIDAVPLMKSEKGRAKEVNPDKPQTPFTIKARELSAVLMGEKEGERLTNVDIELNHDPLWWHIIKVNADVPNGKRLVFSYAPDDERPNERHKLYVETKDGGAAIRALAIYDSISGGQLEITGSARHDELARPLRGKLKMSSYRLLNQSFLARFFTVASLTGVIDIITGEGFLFNEASAEFTKTRDQTDIHSFRSAGPSIGITACGRVNMDQDKIDMSGTLAPAYLINGILGNIPLLGPMLQGGEGKGAFAFTYILSGSLSEPDINVNPLSVLTPGFLRGIFSGDQEGCGKEQEKSKIVQPQSN